jgi:hypothetical protein
MAFHFSLQFFYPFTIVPVSKCGQNYRDQTFRDQLPWLEDNRWEGPAGQLARVPGGQMNWDKRFRDQPIRDQTFRDQLPWLEDDRGEGQSGRLARVPGGQMCRDITLRDKLPWFDRRQRGSARLEYQGAKLRSLLEYKGGSRFTGIKVSGIKRSGINYLGSKTAEGRARLASLLEYQGGRPPM